MAGNNLITFIIIIILFVLEGFFEVAILSLPGAFLRWIFDGRKRKFKEYYKERAILNTILGVILLAILFLIFVLLVKVFT